MSTNDRLARHVPAGQMIKPWLMWGPIYEDLSASVQGLTLYERPGATVGRTAMAEIVQEARPILLSQPREAAPAVYRGQSERWRLVRAPEEYLSWGRYNISNHLGAAFLTTTVAPQTPGPASWRLALGIASRAVVVLNGQVVFDTDAHPTQPNGSIYGYDFEAALTPGANVLMVGLWRLGRMAQVGFRLEVTNADLNACVPLPEGVSESERAAVEGELASLRLARDVFYGEHTVGITLGRLSDAAPRPLVRLLSEGAETLHQVSNSKCSASFSLPRPSGAHKLKLMLQLAGGCRLHLEFLASGGATAGGSHRALPGRCAGRWPVPNRL